jgi:ATP-dependent NAD(P)H-hydrate dehydratase
MPEKPEMSSATKELLKKVRMIVPPMLEKFHKGSSFGCPATRKASNIFATGQLGRVAVIGGSEKYPNPDYYEKLNQSSN